MKKILLLTMIMITIGLNAQDINSYEPLINDARAKALGNSSMLGSAGANFLFSNPSNLKNISTLNVQANGFMKSGETKRKRSGSNSKTTKHDMLSKFSGVSLATNLQRFLGKEIVLSAGYRPYFDHSYYVNEHEYAKGGFNVLTIGGNIKLIEKLYFGGSFNTSAFSEVEVEYSYGPHQSLSKKYVEDHTGTFFTLSGTYLLTNCLTISAMYTSSFEYEIDSDEPYMYNKSYIYGTAIKIPAQFGFALQYNYKDLNLFGEYKTRRLDDYEIRYLTTGGFSILNRYSDAGFEFNSGIEYGKDLKIRGGIFLRSLPLYNQEYIDNDTIIYSDPHEEVGFTLGAGYQYKNINLDLYGSISSTDNNITSYSATELLIQTDFDYKMKDFGMTLGYSF